MDIVVLVKQVPDTWAERRLSESDYTLDRESVDAVMNEIDEYGIEEALRLKEAHGGEVTVLSMGPDRAAETIRKALSMGADKGVHVSDDALHGACAVQTVTVADLGLDAGSVGLASATSEVVEMTPRPPRQAGQIVKDEGDGGVKLADFLAAQKLL